VPPWLRTGGTSRPRRRGPARDKALARSLTGASATVFTAFSSMTFGASSSSAIPFLKLLMPLAMSPISSDTLPLPKSSMMMPPMMRIFQILRPSTETSAILAATN
jgi:hypothetical protein